MTELTLKRPESSAYVYALRAWAVDKGIDLSLVAVLPEYPSWCPEGHQINGPEDRTKPSNCHPKGQCKVCQNSYYSRRRCGTVQGRWKPSDEAVAAWKAAHDAGESFGSIARRSEVNISTVSRYVQGKVAR